MRTIQRAVVGAIAMIATGVLLIASANAALAAPYYRVYQERDYAGIDMATRWVEVCDMEQDGNGVTGTFSGTGRSTTIPDPNGSAGGCGNAVLDFTVDEVSVCEKDFGLPSCSIMRIGS